MDFILDSAFKANMKHKPLNDSKANKAVGQCSKRYLFYAKDGSPIIYVTLWDK